MTRHPLVALAGAQLSLLRAALLAMPLAVLGAACSEPTNTAPTQLNLDRPVDIGFACHGSLRVTNSTDLPIQSAQPTISCDLRSRDPLTLKLQPDGTEPPLEPKGQVGAGEVLWYGFILQSAPGTVAVAQWATVPSTKFASGSVLVLDADRLTPSKNSISVGEEPIAIATDRTGCYEVIANAGSCDLSELDVNSAVANSLLNGHPDGPVKVSRLRVTNAAGQPILARPAAMIAEPSLGEEAVGGLCGPTPTGLVYIAYPGCSLVAAVDAATGKMVAGIKFSSTGVQTTDGNQSCPAECVDGTGKPDPATGGLRPIALSFEATTRRLAIGADNSSSIAVVDLDPGFLPMPAVVQVPLEVKPQGQLGVTALALSPVIGMGGSTKGLLDDDATPGGKAQFVYAVASDGTVRVVNVYNGMGAAAPRECDTQIDARLLRKKPDGTDLDIPPLQCLPLAPKDRRVGAKGPGIEPIGDGAPLSVAFFTVDRTRLDRDKPPDRPQSTPPPGVQPTLLDDPRATLIGHFAIITATDGISYIVNVDDDDAWDRFGLNADRFKSGDPLGTSPTLVIPHQLRDAGRYRGATETPVASTTMVVADDRGEKPPSCSDLGPVPETIIGGPRATSGPARNLSNGPIAASKADELPGLRSVTCIEPLGADGAAVDPPTVAVSELLFSAPVETRDEVFPDLRGLRLDEQWFLTWEGSLSLDNGGVAIDGPVVRNGRTKVDGAGLHLVDPSRPFCDIGVEPYDFVQFRGCNPANANLDCPSGYTCFLHPESQLGMGACMLSNEADRLANLCRDFLVSGRRYTVAPGPRSGDLLLLPRKHELRTTPIDGCVDDTQCTLLANYAAHARTDKDPVASPVVQPMVDPMDGKLKDVNAHMWSCQADDARAPINTDPAKNRRCVQICTTNADCNVEDDELNRRFNVAQFKMVCQSGVCMEGITPPQQCVNGPQRYDVHASEAFAVVGSSTGYVHPIVEQGGACVPETTANVLQRGRIPLKAPACDPTADPITGRLPSGVPDNNPCSLLVPQSEPQLTFAVQPSSCTVATGGVIVRQAPAIKFRNRGMTLTLVDPTYPGDGQCALDRLGQYGNMPLVYQGYQLAFHQTNGFAPLTLSQINPAFPIKVVRGPTESIWILDDGDFLSTSINQASTRGKVFRLESTNTSTISLLQ
jgi:hypothetical protein